MKTSEDTPLSSRKKEHINVCLNKNVNSTLHNGLERYSIRPCALPEGKLEQVDTTIKLLGYRLNAPLLISSMTGGTNEGTDYNRLFAMAADHFGIALALGSQRVAIENPEHIQSFAMRSYAPHVPIFANLGAVQLNYGYGLRECQMAVDMAQADALYLHLNPLQEALQKEGNSDFSALLPKIEAICTGLSVPVFVKEVGNGISASTAKQLLDAGVNGIDVAGAGGSSWAMVEMYRHTNPQDRDLCHSFAGWGLPTATCVRELAPLCKEKTLIASGGLRTGLDLLKSLALGANLGGIALPFLIAASNGKQSLFNTIELILQELKISLFASGCQNLSQVNLDLLYEKE